jgi:peptidoglycan/LPS O-acetylase OafA/YrhL
VTVPALAAKKSSERFALDGYRAVAAVAVLTFHAYQYNRLRYWPLEGTVWHDLMLYSDLAVDMFFVLSGLLLGLPFARAALGMGSQRSAPARAADAAVPDRGAARLVDHQP